MPGDLPEALVVCISHPPDCDLTRLAELLSASVPAPVELRLAAYREGMKLRMARRSPPVDAQLLASAPAIDAALRAAYADADVILALDFPVTLLEIAPKLKLVQAYSSGVEHFDRAEFERRGVTLVNSAGAGAVAIAEYALARILEVWKRSREVEAMQRERRMKRIDTRLLSGATLGIVGLGAIGSELAERARALGMRVIASRRDVSKTTAQVDRLVGATRSELLDLLAASDVVVLCAPDSPETRDMIDAEALSAMRPGATLCNVARGNLVDEAALIAALEQGQLGAAILDVTRTEPLPATDPLWDAPNLYLSPHSAVSSQAYDERVLEAFVERVARLAANERAAR